MTRLSTGALDEAVTAGDQLRADIDYDRPPGGGDAIFDMVDVRDKRVLDYGCGLGSYRRRLERRGAEWVGLELTGPAASVIGDGNALPFTDGVFDAVLCAAVLEHMPEPDQTMREIRRVLADGGIVFGYVAFLEPFHGMSYYHMSHMGLEYLLFKHGFRPLRIFSPHNGPAYQIECMLFPRHIPILRPLVRHTLQGIFAAAIAANRLARWAIRRATGRPATDSLRYRRLMDLRFGIGFNFIAEKMDVPERIPGGYAAFVKD